MGHNNFKITPGTMEVGIGHHGEPSIRVKELKNAKDMAAHYVEAIHEDFAFKKL